MVSRTTCGAGVGSARRQKTKPDTIAASSAARPSATRRLRPASRLGDSATRAADPSVAVNDAASSRTKATVAASATRRVRSFSRHRLMTTRIAGGTFGGSALQSGWLFSTFASVSETSSPSNARLAGQHFIEHGSPAPTRRFACLPRAPSPAPDSCRPRSRGSPRPVIIAGDVIVARLRPGWPPGRPARVDRLRQPEIEHLDGAVWPQLDVRGLQIAMDDARAHAPLRALGQSASRSKALHRVESRPARSGPRTSVPRPTP